MLAQLKESLMRAVIGGLGATLFGAACLLAAAGPLEARTAPAATLSQPAPIPHS